MEVQGEMVPQSAARCRTGQLLARGKLARPCSGSPYRLACPAPGHGRLQLCVCVCVCEREREKERERERERGGGGEHIINCYVQFS